jgi:hypothetical protein
MKMYIIAAIVFLFPTLLFGNGSPINRSEIYGTGNIEMMKKKNISLDEETVSILIDGDYANVNLEYKFGNHGQADTVTYGFPIDLYYESEQLLNLAEKSLTNFKIEDSTGFLKAFKFTPRSKDEVSKLLTGTINGQKRLREWFISEIPFKEKEAKTVKVSYRVKNRLDDWVFTKSFRPEFSDRTFTYLLKPSQNWGDGIVKKCTIRMDLRNLLKSSGIIKEIYPKGYTNEKGVLTWKCSNLDLKRAEDIKLVYDNSAAALTKYISGERIQSKHVVSVKASSVLKTDEVNIYNYEPKNLFDNDLNTAWCEGVKGHGEGQWVEFNFAGNVSVGAIGIINGYTKREALYYANNRIKKIKLDVEYQPGEYDERNPSGESKKDLKKETTAIDLKQLQFNELNKNVQAPFISWLADYDDNYRRVNKIRLTILEVSPGTKYNDTCISEVYFIGYVQK